MIDSASVLTPTVVFVDNPFGSEFTPPIPVKIGMRIRDTLPPELGKNRAIVLNVNGEWLLTVDWDSTVRPGDKIAWHLCLPQGGNASRAILMVVAFIVIAYFTAGIGNVYYQAAARIALGLAASALINALVPAQAPKVGGNAVSPGSVYNIAVSGNQARLNSPIPVIYGRQQIFPDFACNPYSEFAANNQFFNCVYCIGQGSYAFERLQIDDTPFASFPDIWYHILPPGVKPTRIAVNVVTAPEVVDQDLKSGVLVGGFAASQPQSLATHIGIDIGFPNGLAHVADDGTMASKTVQWRVDYQYIDDFGVPTAAWAVLASESYSGATSTPQRVTKSYPLPTPGRVQVRLVRTNTFDDNARELNTCHWIGMRAYIQANPADLLEPTCTHLEVRIRANQQLSDLTQRKIGMIVRRKLQTWNPTDGWVALAEYRGIAWALADIWMNADYGDGLPEERIDLQTLYELEQVWNARQDHLDIVFDSKVTSWDAAKTVAQVGRATPFRRYGVCTVTRDQNQELPVTAFTSRNIRPNSVSVGYALATEETADAVVIEYFHNRIWDWVSVQCNAPGVTDPVNPVKVRISGITGSFHAHREGVYMAAVNMYRRKFPTWESEMLGLLPCYGDTVVFAPTLSLAAAAGDVVDWELATETTEPGTVYVWESGGGTRPFAGTYATPEDAGEAYLDYLNTAWAGSGYLGTITSIDTTSSPTSFTVFVHRSNGSDYNDSGLQSIGTITTPPPYAGILTLTENVTFEGTELYQMRFQRLDGSLTDPVTAYPGPAPNKVILAYIPDYGEDFDFNTHDPDSDRVKWVFGKDVVIHSTVKLIGIRKRDRDKDNVQYVELSATNEDVRVHTADFPYLPAPGEIQDPVDGFLVDDEGGTGSLYVANVTTHTFAATGAGSNPDPLDPPRPTVTITLDVDGTFFWQIDNKGGATTSGIFVNEWILDATIDHTISTLFTARLRVAGDNFVPPTIDTSLGLPLDTWENLGTAATWVFQSLDVYSRGASVTLDIATTGGIIQASAVLYFQFFGAEEVFGPGGGDGVGGADAGTDAGAADAGGSGGAADGGGAGAGADAGL